MAAIAGDALKKTVLGLGGFDPFIVTTSADLGMAPEVAVTARCQNNGQSCIAAKRFLVHAEVAEEFTGLFAQKLAVLTVGDPMDPGSQVGPLATESGLADVERYVADAVAKGATVVVGGQRVQRPGRSTSDSGHRGDPGDGDVLRGVFGPVAALYTVDSLEEAIGIANDQLYGLSANLWSEDPGERQAVIRGVPSGMAFVNAWLPATLSCPRRDQAERLRRERSPRLACTRSNAKTVWIGPPSSQQTAGDTAETAE